MPAVLSAKLKFTLAPIEANPPNLIPINISGYVVCQTQWVVDNEVNQLLNFLIPGKDDWNIVVIECGSLAAKWEELSTCLGLPYGLIASIKGNHPNDNNGCWSDALNQWISQNYNTDSFGVPSWMTLLKAVAKVDQLLYKKLAKKYQSKFITLKTTVYVHQYRRKEHTRTPSPHPCTQKIISTLYEYVFMWWFFFGGGGGGGAA